MIDVLIGICGAVRHPVITVRGWIETLQARPAAYCLSCHQRCHPRPGTPSLCWRCK